MADGPIGRNHGSVATAAVAFVRLTTVNVDVSPSTFEYVAAPVTTDQSSCLVVVFLLHSSLLTYITLFVMKACLDPTDLKSHGPISNYICHV